MDRAASLHRHRAGFVDGFADDVDDAPERAGADRHGDRPAGVGHVLAAHQALGGVHRDAAHGVFAQVLGDFQHQARALVVGLQRVENGRQIAVELHVDDGADDLGDAAGGVRGFRRSAPFLDVLVLQVLVIARAIGSALQRLGAGDDLDQFLGDHRLAGAVVAQRVFLRSFRRRCGWRCPSRSSARRRTRRRSPAARG